MAVVVGIDEVGRGCWAGPVVAAAVILTKQVNGLTDSKKLTRVRREQLYQAIKANSHYGLGWASASVVDELGLTEALARAMKSALGKIGAEFQSIVIDGNYNFLSADARATAVVKADLTHPAVSAASILAKVARDNYMARQALKIPNYDFEKHVGYGTAAHLRALTNNGVCVLHRRSFKPVKAFLS